VEAADLRVIRTEQHDMFGVAIHDVGVNGPPLQATPFPSHILATEHRDDEVGLLAVEIGEIER
jgi:hypothetical protein